MGLFWKLLSSRHQMTLVLREEWIRGDRQVKRPAYSLATRSLAAGLWAACMA
jgi:hypothetical protein